MTDDAERISNRAIDWQLRLADADEDEWYRFIVWLEASPAHAAAFDRVAAQDAALVRPAAAPMMAAPAPVAAPRFGRRRAAWMAGAFAAAASLLATVGYRATPRPAALYAIATRPGETRSVVLADGTRLDLNGASRVRLDRDDRRYAIVDEGQVLFHVRHDAAAPFEVRSGGIVLQDLGTVFDVERASGTFSVKVAEGAVLYQPDADAVRLGGGMALSTRDGGARAELSRVVPAQVGQWRTGRLSFSAAPVAAAIGGIARATGARITLAGGLGDRPFTGDIDVRGDGDAVVRRFAALIGAQATKSADRWTLRPRADADD